LFSQRWKKINPLHWENDKSKGQNYQKVKRSHPNHLDINARLDDLKNKAQKAFRKLQDELNRFPTDAEFKSILPIALGFTVLEEQKQISFFQFIKVYIFESVNRLNKKTGKFISSSTIKPYKTVQNHLTEFQKEYKVLIDWNSLDNSFYKAFRDYLMKKKRMRPNSIGKQFQVINSFVKQAEAEGIIPINSIRPFQVTREEVENISLSEEELNELEKLNLSKTPRLEKVRDIFLLACYTGLRYSDWQQLNEESIVQVKSVSMFNITQQKTQKKVSIPIQGKVREILDRNNGRINRIPSCQKINDYLKEIGKLVPCLNELVERNYRKGERDIIESVPKYTLISSHTARRTFATLQLKCGIPPYIIMAITGHKTEKDFWKYVKLDSQAKALQLHQMWGHCASSVN